MAPYSLTLRDRPIQPHHDGVRLRVHCRLFTSEAGFTFRSPPLRSGFAFIAFWGCPREGVHRQPRNEGRFGLTPDIRITCRMRAWTVVVPLARESFLAPVPERRYSRYVRPLVSESRRRCLTRRHGRRRSRLLRTSRGHPKCDKRTHRDVMDPQILPRSQKCG